MAPMASSVTGPHVLWLNAKTPTNFNSAPDNGHKTIIAVRAQHYSTKKREEQGALLLELQKHGAYMPPVLSAPYGILGPVSTLEISGSPRSSDANPMACLIQTVVLSDAGDTGEVNEQLGSLGKSRKQGYRKGSKREQKLQRFKILSIEEPCASLAMPLQGGNSDPVSPLQSRTVPT